MHYSDLTLVNQAFHIAKRKKESKLVDFVKPICCAGNTVYMSISIISTSINFSEEVRDCLSLDLNTFLAAIRSTNLALLNKKPNR